MALPMLPNELLYMIVEHIRSQKDLSSFAQVNRHIYHLAIPILYSRNAKGTYDSAAIYGAIYNNPRTVQRAVDYGIDVNSKLHPGYHGRLARRPGTLLSFAAQKGATDVFKFLVEAGADINAKDEQGWTPLMWAAYNGHVEIVRRLLALSVDPNPTEEGDPNALFLAAKNGHKNVVDVLLALPEINLASRVNGVAPLDEALHRGHAHVAQSFLVRGAEINTDRHSKWGTPLHRAVFGFQLEILEVLVGRKELNPNKRFLNRTPLQAAIHGGSANLVEILLRDPRTNPDLTYLDNGRTPLLEALINHNGRMVAALLKAGANPNIADRAFLSPAMLLEAPSDETRHKLIEDHSVWGFDRKRRYGR